MPKPIVKKIFVPDAKFLEAHPEMKRSASSLAMEAVVDEQKAIVANAGPDIQKLFAAIKDSDRYEALTNSPGYISSMETDVENLCLQAKAVVPQLLALVDGLEIPKGPECPSGDSKLSSVEPNIAEMKDFWAKQEKFWSRHKSEDMAKIAAKFRIEAMKYARLASELAEAVLKLNELKKEADDLEAKITDDSNLPDFEAMNDPEKKKKVDGIMSRAMDIAVESGCIPQNSAFSDSPVEEIRSDSNPDDKPIKWEFWYEAGGEVISPSKEGAMAMAALRTKRNMKTEHFNVRAYTEWPEHGAAARDIGPECAKSN